MPIRGRLSEFENVLAMLVNHMVLPERGMRESGRRKGARKGQVIFLLGAGCSRQYGLPNFKELITYIWQDTLHCPPDPSWSLEMLRDELDKSWQAKGPEARKEILKFYLDRVGGNCCLGYRRLAELAKAGYVKAFVNMNFDTLLEDALRAVDCDFRVSTAFRKYGYKGLMVYKPHGSIGDVHYPEEISRPRGRLTRATNDLILDIANSDMFGDPAEQKFAQEYLLARTDVVTIGYSGIDAKIAAALRGSSESDPRNWKLFVVNVTPPDPRLLLVMAERSSQNLSVLGEDGSFENFMELLVASVKRVSEGSPVFDSEAQGPKSGESESFMTRDERKALSSCLRLALSIRSAINVADRSPVGIEAHGKEVYSICLRLANIAGNCLTSPEKYLLHCTAYLHDLGYFAGFSSGSRMGGYALLLEHGKKTADLVGRRLQKIDDVHFESIVPDSYDKSSHELFLDMLLELCQCHASCSPPAKEFPREAMIEISGIQVPIRFRLIHAIFAVAEDIVKEHPFLPSSDPVIGEEESRFVIEDPILDLYLRRKKDEVDFILEKGKILGKIVDPLRLESPSKAAVWLLTMAARFVHELNAVSVDYGGWGVNFVCDLAPEQLSVDIGNDDPLRSNLLVDALEEDLDEALEVVRRDSMGEVAGLLDKVIDLLDEVLISLGPEFWHLPDFWNLQIVREWMQSLARTFRVDWIFDGRQRLQRIKLALGRLRVTYPDAFGKEMSQALESADKCLQYLNEGVPHGSLVYPHQWIGLSLRLLSSVRAAHEDKLTPDINRKLGLVISYLGQFRRNMSEYSTGEVASILDLVAIYAYSSDDGEPRVGFDRRPVEKALKWVSDSKHVMHQGLLHLYLPMKHRVLTRGGSPEVKTSLMEQVFLDSFEKIIYPAWRFFARNWHDRSEAVLMARACLDLGSSRFRPELVGGLRHLLGDRITWGSRVIEGNSVPVAHGHDGCTLCTSRLLYIFSYARRLFPQEELSKFSQNDDHKDLNKVVAGIVNYFLSRDPQDPSWWGLETYGDYGSAVRSADYLAWSARAVSFCLEVDQELRDKIGEEWLGVKCGLEKGKVYNLLLQRWGALFGSDPGDILSSQAEEPQTFTLGRVALAYLDLLRLSNPIRELILRDSYRPKFLKSLDEAYKLVWRDSLAQMSQYYLLPVMIVLDKHLVDEKGNEEGGVRSAQDLVKLCQRCLGSRVWISAGPDKGSWGFNVKNSQALVTALSAFWRHAFEHKDRFEKAFESIGELNA